MFTPKHNKKTKISINIQIIAHKKYGVLYLKRFPSS